MSIEFLDELPPDGRGLGGNRDAVLVEFADALRANPGKWARYPKLIKCGASHASQINRGAVASFRGGFRAVSRKGDCYVSYVGDTA